MNRRRVLGTVSGSVVALGGGALAGCGSAARLGQSSQLGQGAARPEGPAVLRLVMPGAPAMPVTVAGFLERFAERNEMTVIAEDVRQWLGATIESVRPELASVRRKMESNGFTDYAISKVFGNGAVAVYGVGNTDGLNFCAPFLVSDQTTAPAAAALDVARSLLQPTLQGSQQTTRQGPVLAEGPALTALHLAMMDWPKGSPVSMMEGLLPLARLHDFGSQFDKGLERPLHYGTGAGDLLIGYDSDPDSGVGKLRVLARRLTGETLLDRRYTFTWR